jgi:hypothetical protein
VGPGRYFCGCGWRIADTDAYGDADRNSNRRCDRDTNSNRRCDSNTNCNRHSDTNTNTHSNAYSYCHSYSYFDAQSDTHAKVRAIGEASSDPGASSIEVFGRSKICHDR